VWFVGAHPKKFRKGEVGERGIGSEFDYALRPDGFVQIAAFRRRALIAPDERRTQHFIVPVEQHRSVHLAAQTNAGNIRGLNGAVAQ
jgi:hypothetical protein